MADYNKEWERTKAYLIRSLFHGVPHTSLSTISEESTQSSAIVYPRSSTDGSYIPYEEYSDTVPSSSTPVNRPAVTYDDDTTERDRSPLPPLVIEKEPNKHDEPEEYYDKLLIKIKKICRKLYLEGRSISDDDFFIDSNEDLDKDRNFCEDNVLNRTHNDETFNVEEAHYTIHESYNNGQFYVDLGNDINANKTSCVINNEKHNSPSDDMQNKLVIENLTSTDPEDLQNLQSRVHAVLDANNTQDSQNVLEREFSVDNTTPFVQQSLEVVGSPPKNSRCYSPPTPLSKETLEQITLQEYEMSPSQIETAQSSKELSFTRTSIGRERSGSPILICPYIPINRTNKTIDLSTTQSSEDAQSPHFIRLTVQAEVHVDADFYSEDTFLVDFNTEPQRDAGSKRVLHSSERQSNPAFSCDPTQGYQRKETLEGTVARTSGMLSSQIITTQCPQLFIDKEHSRSAIPLCHYTPQIHVEKTGDSVTERRNHGLTFVHTKATNSTRGDINTNVALSSSRSSSGEENDKFVEIMRSCQPQTSIDSGEREDTVTSDVNVTFTRNSQPVIQDVTITRSQDSNSNNNANQKRCFAETDYSDDHPRGKKQKHEKSSSEINISSNTSSSVITEEQLDLTIEDLEDSPSTNEPSSNNSESPQYTQMRVQAMVHVDAHLHSQDTFLVGSTSEVQNEARASIVQRSSTDVRQSALRALLSYSVQSPLLKHTLEQTQACEPRMSLDPMVTDTSPRELSCSKISEGEDRRSPILVCQHIPHKSSIIQSLNTAARQDPDDLNSLQLQQINSQQPHSSSHPINALSPQEPLADSQTSVGKKHSESPILKCQYVPHKGMKQAVDILAHRNNEVPDNAQPKPTTEQTTDIQDTSIAINSESEIQPSLPLVQSPPRTPHRVSTPSPIFKETLEQTLARVCGMSACQGLTALSPHKVLSGPEASVSKEGNRSPVLVCHYIPLKRSKQTEALVAVSNTRGYLNLERMSDSEKSDNQTAMKSLCSSDEMETSVSAYDQDQDSPSSSSLEEQISTIDQHIEEMRSSQPHASMESAEIDAINFTSNINLTFLSNTHIIEQEITSQPQNVSHNELTNSNDNVNSSNYLVNNSRSRKRKHEKNICQNRKIDWDALGNIFVGEPKLFKLCSNKDHFV